MQAMLEHVEGISLVGLASPVNAEALRRMPNLRIIIADGMDVTAPLTDVKLPKLAMLSWREKAGRELSFGWNTVRKAAVIDLQGCPTLTDLPDGMEVCEPCASNLLYVLPLRNLLCLVARPDICSFNQLGFAHCAFAQAHSEQLTPITLDLFQDITASLSKIQYVLAGSDRPTGAGS